MKLRSFVTLVVVSVPLSTTPLKDPSERLFAESKRTRSIINLAAAENFVLLSAGAISNQNYGTTVLQNGSLSWAPMGFGTLLLNVSVSPVPILVTANTNRISAYARARSAEVGPGSSRLSSFSGTFLPGVHAFLTNFKAADVLLDGAGEYIFQFPGNVAMGDFTLTLTHGASASDVFFVTPGSFTLNGNSTLQGTVLAGSSIILNATSGDIHVTGRLFSGANVQFTSTPTAANNITVNGNTRATTAKR